MARILVVDDAAFMRVRACKVLVDNGHEVEQAENGVEAIRQIRRDLPDTEVVVLSVHDSEPYVVQALRAGAAGYVLKRNAATELAAAIRAAHDGQAYLHPSIARRVIDDYLSRIHASEDAAAEPHERLTPRETEILAEMGKFNDELVKAGASEAAIVQVPDSFPTKWDLADEPPAGRARGQTYRAGRREEPEVAHGERIERHSVVRDGEVARVGEPRVHALRLELSTKLVVRGSTGPPRSCWRRPTAASRPTTTPA